VFQQIDISTQFLPHASDNKVITVKEFGDWTNVASFYGSYKFVQESTPIQWNDIATEIQTKFIKIIVKMKKIICNCIQ